VVTEYDQSGVRRTTAGKGNGPLGNDVVESIDPSLIMQIGMSFRPAKTLLSAVELDLFTLLGSGELTGTSIAERLGLCSRAMYDFLDGLVALRLLERDGQGETGRYRNTPETALFLDRNSPAYLVRLRLGPPSLWARQMVPAAS
jgi:Dimerisation domain